MAVLRSMLWIIRSHFHLHLPTHSHFQLRVWRTIKAKVTSSLWSLFVQGACLCRKSWMFVVAFSDQIIYLLPCPVAPCAREWDEFKQCHSTINSRKWRCISNSGRSNFTLNANEIIETTLPRQQYASNSPWMISQHTVQGTAQELGEHPSWHAAGLSPPSA